MAPSVEPGRYDLVIDPSNLWLTIHESVGHATEYDRAIGYEAAYAGTSFATPDLLGTLRYGSPLMHVTGDRTVPHGLATIGYDDDGVATGAWDLVRDGILVGYQLDRTFAPRLGLDRSNGCAFADSPHHVPLQRMANVSLQPDGAVDRSTDDLIAGVDDGIYVVGDRSWSIDMQRANFQFTGQRFFRIRGGRLAGQLRDVAYQALTTEFWGSLDGLGGPSTWRLFGAMNCGKAQPGQSAAVATAARRRCSGRSMSSTPRGGGRDATAGDRRAGARRPGRAAAVLVTQTSEAVLRWANSTMTTNGHTTAQDVAVVALEAVEGGTAVGVVSSGAPLRDAAAVDDLVAAARRAARRPVPARDVAPLPEPAPTTGVARRRRRDVDRGVRSAGRGPGRQSSTARSATTASPPTSVSTVWLGTSTGRAQAVGAADGLDRAQRQDPGPRRLGVDGPLDRRLHRRRRRRARAPTPPSRLDWAGAG